MIGLPDVHICAFRARGRDSIRVEDFHQLEGLRIGSLSFDIEATMRPEWAMTLRILMSIRATAATPFPVEVAWSGCPDGSSA